MLPVLCALSLAATAVACRDRVTSGPGLPFPAVLAVAPGVSSVAGGPVFDLVGVRVTLTELSGRSVVLDTVATFSVDDTTIRLAAVVQLTRPSQDFVLRAAAADIAGDTLFRATDTVTLRQNEPYPLPTPVLLQYAGPDTLVAAISIAPRDTAIIVGVPLLMRVQAIGFDQAILKSVRIGWRSSNPASITVSPDGTVLALAPTQGVWIVARTATGRADSTQISAAVPVPLPLQPDTPATVVFRGRP